MFKCSCEKAQISQSSVKKFTNSQPSFLNRRKTSRKGPSQSLCTNEFKTLSSVYDSLWMNTGKPPQDCVLQSEHLVLDQRQGTLTPMVSWNWSISGEIDFFESSLSGHIKVWDPLDWNHLFGRMKNMNVYIYIYIHMSYTYISKASWGSIQGEQSAVRHKFLAWQAKPPSSASQATFWSLPRTWESQSDNCYIQKTQQPR